MKNRILLWIFILGGFINFPLNSLAQNKLEKEEGIPEDKAPAKAVEFLHDCCKDIKKDWFLERNLEGRSIEAKFKLFDQWHSVEFDIEGEIEDVEILYLYKLLSEEVREEIEEELEEEFSKYKIERVQIQYTGDPEAIQKYLLGEPVEDLDIETAYELIILGIKEKDVKRFEFLFDDEGELEEKLEIITRETDNLAY